MTDLGRAIMVYLFFLMFTALALFMMFAGAADAHEWYNTDCCSDQDCGPVPDGVVTDAADGGVDVDMKGFHGHLVKGSGYIRKSQDTHDHVCIHNHLVDGINVRDLKCVYRADRGV